MPKLKPGQLVLMLALVVVVLPFGLVTTDDNPPRHDPVIPGASVAVASSQQQQQQITSPELQENVNRYCELTRRLRTYRGSLTFANPSEGRRIRRQIAETEEALHVVGQQIGQSTDTFICAS